MDTWDSWDEIVSSHLSEIKNCRIVEIAGFILPDESDVNASPQ